MQIQGFYPKSDYNSAVIIPCYNEEKRINPFKYYAGLKDFSSQIILVDDGSKDNTFSILKRMEKTFPDRFIAVKSSENQGKAEAVRLGMNFALDNKFKKIGFTDADLATPFKEISPLLKAFEINKDINTVIGVRLNLAGHDIERSDTKFFMQKIIAKMGSFLIGKNVSDTQCGAKMFKASVLKPAIKEKFSVNWLFDQELLTRISKLKENTGINWLYEQPLSEWKDVLGSHVKKSDYIKCLKEYFRLVFKYGIKKPH